MAINNIKETITSFEEMSRAFVGREPKTSVDTCDIAVLRSVLSMLNLPDNNLDASQCSQISSILTFLGRIDLFSDSQDAQSIIVEISTRITDIRGQFNGALEGVPR